MLTEMEEYVKRIRSLSSEQIEGMCFTYCKEMIARFGDHLRMVHGYYLPEDKPIESYHALDLGSHNSHWWCETINGEILDPTEHQFEYKGFHKPVSTSSFGSCLMSQDIKVGI